MSEKEPHYITTTLPYVNDEPHIGHALEFIQADALARYWRLMGHEVFFNTGTDEHGQKILRKAEEKGEEVQAYVDRYAARFKELIEGAFGLSFDAFIRTTDEHHVQAAQHIWKRCKAAGDIEKRKYKGLYCVGCEAFKTESDLIDGLCPDHKKAPEEIEEENYFFKLSNYQTYLEEYLSREGVVMPEWRRKEALAFVQSGLEDFSISREKSRMSWGIPVPEDDTQVMYVWFDALTNYISTLGWPDDQEGNFKKFWQEGQTLQVAGKDQVRFQSIMWQAMLKSAGIVGTDTIFYHGFITSGGHKMSKSVGNVISPFEMVERYGRDATRYLLLRHVHPTDDSDITWEKMDEWYTANLVNGLGNLVARVMKMAETHLTDGEVGEYSFAEQGVSGDHELVKVRKALDRFDYMDAMDVIWASIGKLDELITEKEPFRLVKEKPEEAKEIIANLRQLVFRIGVMLEPAMPDTAKIIQDAAKENKKPENLFARLNV